MSDRQLLRLAFGLAALFAAATFLLSRSGPPRLVEAVPWKPLSALGPPPYRRAVLLDFSADWCEPCQRMQLTTFRDREFATLLDKLALDPFRIEDTPDTHLAFEEAVRRYHVAALPALVVIGRDGRFLPAVAGVSSADGIFRDIADAAKRATKRLFWEDAQFFRPDPLRPIVIRSFDKWWLVDQGMRRDWRVASEGEFVGWANQHLSLVRDQWRGAAAGSRYYREYDIKAVPTVIVEDLRGRILARFEGSREVEGVPEALAKIAEANGIQLPSPPSPSSRPRPD